MAKTTGRQTSRKAGLTSTAQKMDSSRHGYGTVPAARKAAGAHGAEDRGSRRKPGTATSKRGMAAALRSMQTTGTGRKASGASRKAAGTSRRTAQKRR
jgi:hypothetical protein